MELIVVVGLIAGALVLGLIVGANNKRRVDAARAEAEAKIQKSLEEIKKRKG